MVEVLVSVIVLAIAVVPVFDALVRGRVLVAHRGEERAALRLVERKAEQLLVAGYNAAGSDADIRSLSLTEGRHPNNPTILLLTRGDSDASNDVYGDLTWSVAEVTHNFPAGGFDPAVYKTINLKLAWPIGAHRDSVTLMTIKG